MYIRVGKRSNQSQRLPNVNTLYDFLLRTRCLKNSLLVLMRRLAEPFSYERPLAPFKVGVVELGKTLPRAMEVVARESSKFQRRSDAKLCVVKQAT
jgi:hypothetical protein